MMACIARGGMLGVHNVFFFPLHLSMMMHDNITYMYRYRIIDGRRCRQDISISLPNNIISYMIDILHCCRGLSYFSRESIRLLRISLLLFLPNDT